MSLVDYASSDEEEDEAVGRDGPKDPVNPLITHQNQPPHKTHLPNHPPSRLPDASFLLDSPSLPSNSSGIYDHTSVVAAAMAQNASRKRDFKETATSYPHGKIPRGNLPHSNNAKKAASSLLCPPQLSGSNYDQDRFTTSNKWYQSQRLNQFDSRMPQRSVGDLNSTERKPGGGFASLERRRRRQRSAGDWSGVKSGGDFNSFEGQGNRHYRCKSVLPRKINRDKMLKNFRQLKIDNDENAKTLRNREKRRKKARCYICKMRGTHLGIVT